MEFIHIEVAMRTNIDIDDELLARAMEAAGTTTKKATVEEALRRLIQNLERRNAIAELRGIGWEGDLDEMRQGRNFDHIK
jgi:Arc/MetJ family transcription regulator